MFISFINNRYSVNSHNFFDYYHFSRFIQITVIVKNVIRNIIRNIIKKLNECKFCNKVLSRYDSLKRHEQKCNFNNVINSSKNKDEIITMLTNTVKQQS